MLDPGSTVWSRGYVPAKLGLSRVVRHTLRYHLSRSSLIFSGCQNNFPIELQKSPFSQLNRCLAGDLIVFCDGVVRDFFGGSVTSRAICGASRWLSC